MALGACYPLTVSIFYFLFDIALFLSWTPVQLVCLVRAGQTFLAWFFLGSELRSGSPTIVWLENWKLRAQRNSKPHSLIRQQPAQPLGFWGVFSILFLCSEWLCWSVKWRSMLPVLSLRPSFTFQLMMVLWLHFFRLAACSGSSTFFRQGI